MRHLVIDVWRVGRPLALMWSGRPVLDGVPTADGPPCLMLRTACGRVFSELVPDASDVPARIVTGTMNRDECGCPRCLVTLDTALAVGEGDDALRALLVLAGAI